MRLRLFLACLATSALANPALAGVDEVVKDHILPAFDRFAAATEALATAAQADCTAPALQPAYQQAFDAWMGIAHLHFGPLESDGRNLAIAFWPDTRGMVGRTVAGLVASQDSAVATPQDFAEVSVAGRGLFAMEELLFDTAYDGYAEGDYSCTLAMALAGDMARMGRDLQADWQGFAPILLSAGTAGNAVYLTRKEAGQELYTALMTGLEFTADQRLGRPLGTFDRPRPTRAEARRSGRPLRNVVLSLEALRDLARTLAEAPIPVTEAAFADALGVATDLDDPVFAGVENPMGRLRVEILQQRVQLVRDAVTGEIGTALGLAAGFNSADGD